MVASRVLGDPLGQVSDLRGARVHQVNGLPLQIQLLMDKRATQEQTGVRGGSKRQGQRGEGQWGVGQP